VGRRTVNNDEIEKNYNNKPITFLQHHDPSTRWPKKLREIFADIWFGRAGHYVIMKAPRGGGKSRFLGSLGFALWFFKHKKVVDMGGSYEQAKGVYNYFLIPLNANKCLLDQLPKEPTMDGTIASDGSYFKAVTASPRQVRGPHPDVLMSDETCETKDELILSALPMVDTSEDPLIIMTSTFHKIFGIFQDTWDNADQYGYTRYSWDIFDVAKEFDPAIWNDKQLLNDVPDLAKLEKLADGKTGDPEGWVPIMNIINAWRSRRSDDWFLVEMMGARPSAEGMVNDPIDVEACIFDDETEKQYNYQNGAECVLGIDWGFSSMTAVIELMSHLDGAKVQLSCKTYEQVASEKIINDTVTKVYDHRIKVIYADSAGKFENNALVTALSRARSQANAVDKERYNCRVVEVVFGREKFGTPGSDGDFSLLGNYRAYFQRQLLRIPKSSKISIWQHKRYRYAKDSDKPVKKDDHIPDATMCALKHWPLGVAKVNINEVRQTGSEDGAITEGLLNKIF
jgi:hypothetical protein